MVKRIAVLVRDRKHEALRMALGATLAQDSVDVYVMDDILELDEEISTNLEMLDTLKVKVYSNNPANPFEQKSTDEIAKLLADYDVVIPY